MDGALQTLTGLGFSRKADRNLALPFALDQLDILAPLTAECFAYACKDSNSLVSVSGMNKFTVRITDCSGKVLVILKGFSTRNFKKDSSQDNISKQEKNTLLCFEPVFKEKVLQANLQKQSLGTTMMLCGKEEWQGQLRKQLCTQSIGVEQLISVNFGEKYECLYDNQYVVNPKFFQDYEYLLHDLKKTEKKIDTVIYTLDFTDAKDLDRNIEEESIRVKAYLETLICLVQSWIKQGRKDRVKLLCLVREFKAKETIIGQALGGFLQTLVQEHFYFQCKLVVIREEKKDIKVDNMAQLVSQELLSFDDNYQYLRYENGSRMEQSYKEIEQNRLIFEGSSFSPDGVYVITGGLGGLGLIFARYLLKYGAGRVALLGRSEIDSKKQAQLDKIEAASNGAICYIRCNIADKKALAEVFNQMKNTYGSIKWVIHSAGMLYDTRIAKKELNKIEDVLAPKVKGTLFLDVLTQEEPLEFFVLFSSIASVLGNVGQCDYAYANGFMDSYAWNRQKLVDEGKRSGRTVSINWPLWQEGGMQVDKASKQILFRSTGMRLLGSKEGTHAFAASLKYSSAQWVVLSGNAEKIRSLFRSKKDADLTDTNELVNRDTFTLTVTNGSPDAMNILLDKTRSYFKEVISTQLKITSDDLKTNRSFDGYGVDSIVVTRLTNELEKDLGNLPKTLFFEYQTIDSLAEYFVKEHTEQLQSLLLPEQPMTHDRPEVQSEETILKPAPVSYAQPLHFNHASGNNERQGYSEGEGHDIAIVGVQWTLSQGKGFTYVLG